MIIMFYACLAIFMGSLSGICFVTTSSIYNFNILGCILFISFIGHLFALWRELDRQEESYRRKIREK